MDAGEGQEPTTRLERALDLALGKSEPHTLEQAADLLADLARADPALAAELDEAVVQMFAQDLADELSENEDDDQGAQAT